MKFCWSTLNVNNLEDSIRFYTEVAGLEVVNRFKAGPSEIAFLGSGETKIELICNGGAKKTNTGDDISWGIEVPSLDNMLELVKEKGISIEAGPMSPSPHIKFFIVRDPNGMKIQFVENL